MDGQPSYCLVEIHHHIEMDAYTENICLWRTSQGQTRTWNGKAPKSFLISTFGKVIFFGGGIEKSIKSLSFLTSGFWFAAFAAAIAFSCCSLSKLMMSYWNFHFYQIWRKYQNLCLCSITTSLSVSQFTSWQTGSFTIANLGVRSHALFEGSSKRKYLLVI